MLLVACHNLERLHGHICLGGFVLPMGSVVVVRPIALCAALGTPGTGAMGVHPCSVRGSVRDAESQPRRARPAAAHGLQRPEPGATPARAMQE